MPPLYWFVLKHVGVLFFLGVWIFLRMWGIYTLVTSWIWGSREQEEEIRGCQPSFSALREMETRKEKQVEGLGMRSY